MIAKNSIKILILALLLFSIESKSQSLTGTRGLIKAPTARMYDSGTISIGMGYIPSKFFYRTFNDWYGREQFQGTRTGNAGLTTYITVTTLPFMEIMFRYTHELNMKVNQQTTYFPDRMFSVRFKLLNEKKNIPAIVLGLQDISAITETTCIDCSNFTATYLVGSKKFSSKNISFDLSIGYAADLIKLPAKDFKGLFGGIELFYNKFDKAQLLIEYDSKSLNIGIQTYIMKRFHTVFGLMDLEPTFVIAYRYKI